MGLNETTRHVRDLLAAITADLEKAASGNKAASQRVRTGTIRLEKTAKNYRRESIAAEKSGTGPKKASKKKASKAAHGKSKAKVAAKPTKAKPAKAKPVKAKAKVKVKAKAKAVVMKKSVKKRR